MTPTARIEALYQQGRYAEGQRLNVAVAVSRGGSIESGGAVKASPRGNGPGLPTSHGQGSSARSLAPAGAGLQPQRMTASVPAGAAPGRGKGRGASASLDLPRPDEIAPLIDRLRSRLRHGLRPSSPVISARTAPQVSPPAKGDAGHRVAHARSAFVGTPAAPLVGALLDNSGEQPG